MSIKPIDFYNELNSQGIEFFSGVPDSLLKEFCLCVEKNVTKEKHIITANEGNAIGLAAGYYLSTGKLPMVYMQNSGLGNAINPLLSLCDQDVYSIPMILMIGWRGEPELKDEPQHLKQGEIQLELLETLKIPYEIISKNDKSFDSKISKVIEISKNDKTPSVLLVRKGVFEKYNITKIFNDKIGMMREEALEVILKNIDDNSIVISTTGKTSREIFEIRKNADQTHEKDFLTVGSMGHCSSIALGIALSKPKKQVICIDGDGSMLMHLGALTSISSLSPKNFRHILINNKVHESVGGQSTAAKDVSLSAIVKGTGIRKIYKAETYKELIVNIKKFLECQGPAFLEIIVKAGSRKNLGRPTIKPIKNKEAFMRYLKK